LTFGFAPFEEFDNSSIGGGILTLFCRKTWHIAIFIFAKKKKKTKYVFIGAFSYLWSLDIPTIACLFVSGLCCVTFQFSIV
jgi:hypothetical protein